ncbi:atypical dual specificity phosphatase [Rhodopirellula rubra]|uniref:Atypical dual specificity phosphatase n=1 Tax=Aporhodopirellula rubra TaxID=980271 RepID=A0A7W5DZU9_9BACT|nr:phosphatidylglycerophosphatase and protein-tyrosine phosphatase 1 family protein [Aporhodopirellula rubra]MBB3207614.1 atypical dual specificity phosphatase [Aporhodopirellula rubra]
MKKRSFYDRVYAGTVFYPTLAWNMMLGRVLKIRNWWDFIDDHVIVGARPFARDVNALAAIGVRAVVNTCEEYGGPVEEYGRHGIVQLHIPTVDFTHPTIENVRQGVEFVQEHVSQGKIVYIHCKAGRARSATVAICWLIQYRQMSAADAQALLLSKRPHINPRLTERAVVNEFIAELKDNEPQE